MPIPALLIHFSSGIFGMVSTAVVSSCLCGRGALPDYTNPSPFPRMKVEELSPCSPSNWNESCWEWLCSSPALHKLFLELEIFGSPLVSWGLDQSHAELTALACLLEFWQDKHCSGTQMLTKSTTLATLNLVKAVISQDFLNLSVQFDSPMLLLLKANVEE